MQRLELRENWTVHAVAGDLPGDAIELRDTPIPATVPGCVHTDLMAAGRMPNPVLDQNELDCKWPAEVDWTYRCTFDAGDLAGEQHVELCFDGIDTVATITLNGTHVADVANMHCRHRFDVKSMLRETGNTLIVAFKAPLPHMRAEEKRIGWLPATGYGTNPRQPHNMMRKMSCNSGWDWGPQLTTVGLWRRVRLEAFSKAMLGDVRVHTDLRDDGTASVTVTPTLHGDTQAKVEAVLTTPGGITQEQSTGGGPLHFEVHNAQLWHPHTHGEPTLHKLELTCGNDQRTLHIGLRTCELDTTEDEAGSTYRIVVNGQPIFVRGANWIPDDIFPHRVTRERLRDRLTLAKQAGINLLRIWGGGTFESDDFYELCDELGILVQQDFLFACALYPEEEPYRTLVEAEVRDNVSRLSRFGSLVLYNGCNENLWAYFSWGIDAGGWSAGGDHKQTWGGWAKDEGRTWGGGYYFDLLPSIVDELGEGVPYYAGSPYPGSMDRPDNCDAHGTRHEWARRFDAYRTTRPRFMAEYGAQGMPTRANLAKVMTSGLKPGSDALAHRQKANGRNPQRVYQPVRHYFGDVPADFDAYHYLTQVAQVRQVETGAAWWRSTFPHCNGIIYWQFNDCWPVTSWAAIDCDPEFVARRKPLWYATRRFYANRFLTIQPTKIDADELYPTGELEVVAHNDSAEPWELGDLAIRLVDFEEGEFTRNRLAAGTLAPRSPGRWRLPSLGKFDPTRTALRVETGGASATWFFALDKDLSLPKPRYVARAERTTTGYRVTVKAETLLRDLSLMANALADDVQVDDQLVTLLPGESHVFEVETPRESDSGDQTKPPVLMSVADAMAGSAADLADDEAAGKLRHMD